MYNAQYFIDKFKAIPDEKWWVRSFHNEDETRSCALGHCGASFGTRSEEERALRALFMKGVGDGVATVNDAWSVEHQEVIYQEWGDTPKERILNALYFARMRGL